MLSSRANPQCGQVSSERNIKALLICIPSIGEPPDLDCRGEAA
jgi:hypothetical protein